MKKISEKYLIFKYVIISYVKCLLCSSIIFAVIFVALKFSGVYAQIETVLNLEYNSPFVLVPLYGFIGLSFLCFFIGLLMYFYKYKRSKTKSAFYKTFSNVLNKKTNESGLM